MKDDCPACHGYGYVRVALDGDMKCPTCKGTGKTETDKSNT